ncbi:MAG: hypothetical protein WBP08_17545 [Saprospiraceae bacterium]|nr:hypothetical protein [Saprospiraceae bacterium]
MKQKPIHFIMFCALVLCAVVIHPSCKTKEGCGLEEKYNNPNVESNKKGKSNLFSKSQRKRMKTKS